MNGMKIRIATLCVICTGMIVASAAFLQARRIPAADDAGTPITVTVTAVAHGNAPPAALPQNEVVVKQQDNVRKIVSWTPVQPGQANLDLVVIVDDSLSGRVAGNFGDLRNFVTTLPAGARVAVVYAQNGGAHFEQPFTTDYAQAAKAFRIPSAIPGSAVGIYDSIRDLLKHWTPAESSRRVLIVVSSGIDLSEGVQDTNPSLNTSLHQAVEAAQRSGVVVYTIYAPDPGRSMHEGLLNLNGQGSLGELASETGGQSYYEGSGNPVSFEPFLQNIHRLLGQQYQLTFLAQTGAKSSIAKLRVTSEQSGIQLHAPEHVYIPASR